MRFRKTLLICGVLAAFACVNVDNTEAQLRRRSSVLRPRTGRQTAVTHPTAPAMLQKRDLVTGKVVQLSPSLIPAAGPSGAQGVGYIFYNDVDTSLNSGSLVVTGLPAGHYYAWLVFFDPFSRKNIYSELVAKFSVPENGARTETALTIGLPNIVNIAHAKQLVVTHQVKTKAQVGQDPVPGGAGYRGGPARSRAVLAANIN